MDLAVRGYSLCGVVWYRTLRVKFAVRGYSLCGVVRFRALTVKFATGY